MQLNFFDKLPQSETIEQKTKREENEELKEWALVYMVFRHSGYQGNLFLLKKDDAIKLCSDECSHGVGRGGAWAFFWTTIDHFIRQNDIYDGRLESFVFIKDNGKQDKDFERLGIKKPTRDEQSRILRDMGYIMICQ